LKISVVFPIVGIAAIMLVLGTILGSFYFPVTRLATYTEMTTDTITIIDVYTSNSTTLPNDSGVYDAFDNHLLYIQSGNLTLIEGNYIQNATLVVEGSDSYEVGLQGVYNGSTESAMVADGFSGLANETMFVADFSESIKGDSSITNYTLTINGSARPSVPETYVISIETNYQMIGGRWLISRETWNILTYKCFAECCLGCA
jgi:hypothetical protein